MAAAQPGVATDLRGKTAVVTGATSGIGEACARELAGMGATVVLAVRSQSKAQATLRRIKEAYPGADVVQGPLIDMSNPDSIRSFASEYLQSGRPLHILVNNGVYTSTRNFTKQGVPELCQVFYLGPYLLTQLLEGLLVASAPSRVVNVASVMHRMGVIGSDPKKDFLQGPAGHFYANTKLANVLFAYELQRRLGRNRVQSCAVDPGSVHTDVWRHSHWIIKKAVELFYAPPDVGAQALLYAAVAPMGEGSEGEAGGSELRFYAPQAFATPLLSWHSPETPKNAVGEALMRHFGLPASTPWGAIKLSVWALAALATAVLDWPVRQMSKGRLLQGISRCPSSHLSCDAELARQLWEASADVAGVPREPRLPEQPTSTGRGTAAAAGK